MLALPRLLTERRRRAVDAERPATAHGPTRGPLGEPRLLDRVPDDWSIEPARATARCDKRSARPSSRAVQVDRTASSATDGLAGRCSDAVALLPGCRTTYDESPAADFGKLATLGRRAAPAPPPSCRWRRCARSRRASDLDRRGPQAPDFTDNRRTPRCRPGTSTTSSRSACCVRRCIGPSATPATGRPRPTMSLPQRCSTALEPAVEDYAAEPGRRVRGRGEDRPGAARGARLPRSTATSSAAGGSPAPNLEQAGLLEIDYDGARRARAADDDLGRRRHAALRDADAGARERARAVLLDTCAASWRSRSTTSTRLAGAAPAAPASTWSTWAIERRTAAPARAIALPRPRTRAATEPRRPLRLRRAAASASTCAGRGTFPACPARLKRRRPTAIIRDLLERAARRRPGRAGRRAAATRTMPGYQLTASAMRWWAAATGRAPYHDPLRVPSRPEAAAATNPFFVDFYRRRRATSCAGLEAREHTAQVPPEEREDREERVPARRTLPVLYCSPTMELGVDIAEPQRRQHAQRPADAGELRPAVRPRRPLRPAGARLHLLLGRQRARPVLLPPPRPDGRRLGRSRRASTSPTRSSSAPTSTPSGSPRPASRLGEHARRRPRPRRTTPTLSRSAPTSAAHRSTDRGAPQRALPRAERGPARDLAVTSATPWWYADAGSTRRCHDAPPRFDDACDRWRGLYRDRARRARRQQRRRRRRQSARPSRPSSRAEPRTPRPRAQLDLLRGEIDDVEPVRLLQLPLLRVARASCPATRSRGCRWRRSSPAARRTAAAARATSCSAHGSSRSPSSGPARIIYHEGARYEVNRVSLPAPRATATGVDRDRDAALRGVRLPPSSGDGADRPRHLRALRQPELASDRPTCSACRRSHPAPRPDQHRRGGAPARRLRAPHVAPLRPHGERPSQRPADVMAADGTTLVELTYGDAATIRRINVGCDAAQGSRTSSASCSTPSSGRWAADEQAGRRAEPGRRRHPSAPTDVARKRVIPYVEDHRNACSSCLPTADRSSRAMASSCTRSSAAIEAVFQLEDTELAAEPLPEPDRPHAGTFCCSTRRPRAARRAAPARHRAGRARPRRRAAPRAAALRPGTGEDLATRRRARAMRARPATTACSPTATSATTAISTGTPPTTLLDSRCATQRRRSAAPAARTATAERDRLPLADSTRSSATSSTSLDEHGYRLPDQAQVSVVDGLHVRPDFVYDRARHDVAVFVDGPVHDHAAHVGARRDGRRAAGSNDGWLVLRFRHDDDWRQRDVRREPRRVRAGATEPQ